MARQLLLVTASLFLISGSAMAGSEPVPGPSPEFDLGLAGLVMVAGAAYLAYRRRHDAE